MTARVTSELLVGSMLRRTSAAGGFATVINKGDATAGGVLVICREREVVVAVIERLLGVDATYSWQRVGPDPSDSELLDEYLKRRRQRDPDLWVIELDIPESERFAAESLPAS